MWDYSVTIWITSNQHDLSKPENQKSSQKLIFTWVTAYPLLGSVPFSEQRLQQQELSHTNNQTYGKSPEALQLIYIALNRSVWDRMWDSVQVLLPFRIKIEWILSNNFEKKNESKFYHYDVYVVKLQLIKPFVIFNRASFQNLTQWHWKKFSLKCFLLLAVAQVEISAESFPEFWSNL